MDGLDDEREKVVNRKSRELQSEKQSNVYHLGTGLFSAEAEGVEHPPKALQEERNSTYTIKKTPRMRSLNLVEPNTA